MKSNANAFTPATLQGGNQFAGWVTTTPGANSITIEAKDRSPNANTRTNSYTVNVTGSSRTPTYDPNGNTLDNGSGQIYDWDAENRLIKITYSDNSSTEFTYDGLSRRVRIVERNAMSAIVSDKRYLWAGGNQPAEERNAAGTTVLKQYHPQGEFIPAATAPLNKLFYTKDHLGSVRELVDANGALQTRYDYDIWGKRVKLSGTVDSEVGYTGHHHHAKSGLILTWYRAYDAESGRWLSADPIGEAGGLNLYGYVLGNPINAWDPLGLDICLKTYDGSHAAVNITDPTSKSGYSEYHYAPASGLGWDDPIGAIFTKGEMTKLEGSKPIDGPNVIRLETTPEQDKRAREYAEKLVKDGGNYSAAGNNCAHAARDVIQAGIGIPIKGPNPVTPNSLKRALEFMKRWKSQYPFKP